GDEQLTSGEYFDRVIFSGADGDEVVIELASTEFDPYLIVIDANENAVAQEDDSPGAGLNVRLAVRLPSTGQFTVIVTSALPGETGGYARSLAATGQSRPGGDVGPGVQGQPQRQPQQPGPPST